MTIGITHGDPHGVGYETIHKAFADTALAELATPVVYGIGKALSAVGPSLGEEPLPFETIATAADAVEGAVNLIECDPCGAELIPGTRSPKGGAAALAALRRAVADLRDGLIDALVTAPVDKAMVQAAIEPERFTGHTDWLADQLLAADERRDGKRPLMVLASREKGLRVALVTTHLALNEVADVITSQLVLSRLTDFHRSLVSDFGLEAPRIAVLALNPHAGDAGLLGSEEKEVIVPAIEEARNSRILAFGPYSADGFWGSGQWARFDGVLAMYHDEGLIPFKTLAMGSGVNYTAGLPYVRTSPDHGTAFDIAGKGEADPSSLREAIYAAIDIRRNRARHAEATANPLAARQLPERPRKPAKPQAAPVE